MPLIKICYWKNISQSGNKAAVVFVQNIGDISELKAKKEELENKGTAVYIMALTNEDIDVSDDENIYVCKTELDLRLKVSELYAAFGSIAEVMTTPEEGETVTSVYTSDFKVGKHNFNTTENTFGASIASVLNIYGCLPAYTNGYNLFDNLNDVYNITQGNASGVLSSNASKIAEFYQSMMVSYSSDSNITLAGEDVSASDIQQAIDQNLRYRFPVVAYNNNEAYVITSKDSSGNYCVNGTQETIEGTYKVIDTYSYLLQIANTTNIVDKTDYVTGFYDGIKFTVPYGCKTSDIAYETYSGGGELTLRIENNTAIFSGVTDGSKYLAGVKTVYDGTIPNVYNSTKYYKVIQYDDENKGQEWYHPYLFKATNLGIINGDQQPDGSLPFNAENPVTRAQYLKMLLVSSGIENAENSEGYWAEKYIRKAIKLGIIRAEYNGSSLNEAFYDEGIQRCEAAYALSRLYIYQADKVKVPSNLYLYNYDVSSQRNSAWKNGQAFSEQSWFESQIKSKLETLTNAGAEKYVDAIYQMYLNGIMVGNENHEFGTTNTLTRAEASKILVMSLFTLDEGLQNVQIVNEGEKTVYIMLYDSEVASYSTETSGTSRYRNENNSSYVYNADFFKNYLDMIGNKKVAFVISIRDVDFDTTTSGYQTTVGDEPGTEIIPSYNITNDRKTNIINKTVSKSIKIINDIKSGLSAANANRTDKIQMPEIYLGVPHTNTNEDWMQLWEQTNPNSRDLYLNGYRDVSESIYNNVANSVGEGTIAGIYFGRENPDEMYRDNGYPTVSYQNASNISDFIHNKGKKLLWIPFSTNATEWYNIGMYTNQGKSCNNGSRDLFDIVMMQPGIFYSTNNKTFAEISNYNETIQEGQDNYDNQMRKIKDLHKSAEKNQVYMYNEPVGGAIKGTNTTISFEIEYDISLVTGRVHSGRVIPKDKAENFKITYEYYKNLINNSDTSYAIYAGGPNEQSYKNLSLERNNNKHCFINHPTYFGSEDGGNRNDRGNEQAYLWFYDEILQYNTDAYYSEDYNNLIYDITKGLLYKGAFSNACKAYLGW